MTPRPAARRTDQGRLPRAAAGRLSAVPGAVPLPYGPYLRYVLHFPEPPCPPGPPDPAGAPAAGPRTRRHL